ncbi:hypothetical protein, partial [Peribacillus tepidiphilus]|uniref:hypothetical protein n=1 Tax=Peribacillus tepidiphilus TaxID=2652445 RepID=UPI0035B52DD7
QRLWGLTCPAAPAGVSHLTLQSTNFFINGYHSQNLCKNNNLLEKSLFKKQLLNKKRNNRMCEMNGFFGIIQKTLRKS